MYEESLRMPFVIRHPASIAPGTVNQQMILNVDFASVSCDYANAVIPDHFQGSRFRALLEGATPDGWQNSMYYCYWSFLIWTGTPMSG